MDAPKITRFQKKLRKFRRKVIYPIMQPVCDFFTGHKPIEGDWGYDGKHVDGWCRWCNKRINMSTEEARFRYPTFNESKKAVDKLLAAKDEQQRVEADVIQFKKPFLGQTTIKMEWCEGDLKVSHGESGEVLGTCSRFDWDAFWGFLEDAGMIVSPANDRI